MKRLDTPPLPEVRTPPLQARARERYEAILAATQAEIGENGLDTLTMYGIARRARITPTSIYRYFESVEQILITIASLALADLESQIGRLVDAARSTDELINAFEIAMRESWRAFSLAPAARGLFTASKFLPQLRAIDEALNRRVVDSMCARFGELAPTADTVSVRRLLTLLIGLSTPTLDLAIRQPRKIRSGLVEEFIETATARLKQVVCKARETPLG